MSSQKTSNSSMTTYQIMTSILTKYKPSKEEKILINSFFMTRYLSSHPGSMVVSNFINRYYKEIPVDIQYDFAKQLLNGRIKWIQMPKKDNEDTLITTNISKYYNISTIHAVEYSKMMSKEELQWFEELYRGQ